MDLLLFFIRRDELDIYDIPIGRIADEFLEYVRVLEEVDLDRAGDFIYMAALLISIKARMLLPRTEGEGEEAEEIDPRQELVERLLEYLRFKEATEALDNFQQRRMERFTRPFDPTAGLEPQVEHEVWANASVFDLISALRRVLSEAVPEPVHAIEQLEYSVDGQLEFVAEALQRIGRVGFVALVRHKSKPFIIATFLAILEMVRRGDVAISVEEEPDEFFVTIVAGEWDGDGRPMVYGASL